jgi:hypothetical protein
MIVHRKGKYLVLSANGSKLLGTHDNEEDAKKQLKAIEISKAVEKHNKQKAKEAK